MALYDFPVSDEMKALGFSRVYKKDKNLVIYNSPAIITSRYFAGDLQSTLHQLERALVQYDKRSDNHFGTEKIERFLQWFAELDIKTDEAQEDAGKEVQRIETLHKQRVLDQINELRAVYAGISSDDWRAGLMSRYEKLHQTVQNNIPELWVGQIQSLSIDTQTRGLNDLGEKYLKMVERAMEDPSIQGVINNEVKLSREEAYSFYILWICSHAYAMRKRNVLDDNEWVGWLQWMRHIFRRGTIKETWGTNRARQMV